MNKNIPQLIIPPQSVIIEKTALELAATWYETGRSQGMISKYKNARQYAKHNVETWIPKAIEILTSMLGREDIPELMKQEIYTALMERTNAPNMEFLDDPMKAQQNKSIERHNQELIDKFKLPYEIKTICKKVH